MAMAVNATQSLVDCIVHVCVAIIQLLFEIFK
jgi:hypothetical protein